MIECTLKPIKMKFLAPLYGKKEKYGVYLQSFYWSVKGYAKKKWAVAVNIALDYDKAMEEYSDDDEIVKKCIEFLNEPPQSKYGKRRKRKPLYGSFEPFPHFYKIMEEDGKKYINARLIVDENKNKMFWGKGAKL